jgi:hypothetical protein
MYVVFFLLVLEDLRKLLMMNMVDSVDKLLLINLPHVQKLLLPQPQTQLLQPQLPRLQLQLLQGQEDYKQQQLLLLQPQLLPLQPPLLLLRNQLLTYLSNQTPELPKLLLLLILENLLQHYMLKLRQ